MRRPPENIPRPVPNACSCRKKTEALNHKQVVATRSRKQQQRCVINQPKANQNKRGGQTNHPLFFFLFSAPTPLRKETHSFFRVAHACVEAPILGPGDAWGALHRGGPPQQLRVSAFARAEVGAQDRGQGGSGGSGGPNMPQPAAGVTWLLLGNSLYILILLWLSG